jgi:uncharacterized coiled-coil protein SlyX
MSNDTSLGDRLLHLEEQFAHQQHTVEQINEVVIGLRSTIERLEAVLSKQHERIEELEEHEVTSEPEDEKPPHY